jgi:glycosyltransferase involved in cell wall biosynthesis
MRIAIVHYWFLADGGGEKVIGSLAKMYPGADIFCLFADRRKLPNSITDSRLYCSSLDRIPFSHRINRALFPFYSAAIGSFDFSDYDLIISSDSPPVKAIIPSIDTLHISYCHTPGRFIWDRAPAFTSLLPWFVRPLFAELVSNARISDFVAAQRVDNFIANSHYVAQRIRKYYCRHSGVIYPPVEVSEGFIANSHDDYYLSVGRLIKSKRVELLIEACNKLKRRLVIVGEGRDEASLKAIAGPTVEFVGRVSQTTLRDLYSRCRGFLFAADEDFGIVSVEAQSYGRPVIAYGRGGSLETVRVDDPLGRPDTGMFFAEQTPESVAEAILRFEFKEHLFSSQAIHEHAQGFDESVFQRKIGEFISLAMKAKESTAAPVVTMRRRATDARAGWEGIRREA